ncbi:MAG: ImmA/IrrE family metallo-endopeptidase [Gammaproteobacteria bacterium]|nr:ImmA/IrrE family metallo-endopeptidase [Gammaproteobacteria bacterium]
MTDTTQFHPDDWISPPGDTIADVLKERGWSPQAFAKNAGIPLAQAKRLISGDAPIDEAMAVALARSVGSTSRFWLTREAHYRARIRQLREADKLKQLVPWLDRFPIADMMKIGFIPKRRKTEENKPAIVEDLLMFFRMASPEIWGEVYTNMEASFRRANNAQTNLGAVSVWLRAGESQIENIGYSPEKYTREKFENALREIRNLTVGRPQKFEQQMKNLCSEAGVNLALIPVIPRIRVSGVARWIDSERPLIQMSLYGKTNDRFWFTFFHEAAHIILHSKKVVFLDNDRVAASANRGHQEQEADNFAANMLIPKKYLDELRGLQHTKTAIEGFAKDIGIHPGIVVGRMQHENVLHYRTVLNKLKDRFEFKQNVV